MRYVLLLLIFCVSFGVLDSVPRYGIGIASPHITSSPVVIKESSITSAPAPLLVSAPAPARTGIRRKALRPATGAVVLTAPTPAAEDVAHGIVEPGEAVAQAAPSGMAASPSEARPPSELSDAAAAQHPLALSDAALAQVPLENADAEDRSLEAFARSAKDLTGTPLFRDTIRNSLMNPHGVQFGGIAGLNWSGASVRGTAGKVGGRSLTGLTLGVFADVPVRKRLSLRPRVQYAYEGYQPDVNGQRVNIHVAYLNTGSDLVYHTQWLQNRFFVGAGPYMAYAMNGTYTLKGINTDMTFGNNYGAGDNLRRMDYGANFTAGLLMDRNFVLGAGFDLGARNIAPDGFTTRIRTRSFGVSVMYVFRNRPLF